MARLATRAIDPMVKQRLISKTVLECRKLKKKKNTQWELRHSGTSRAKILTTGRQKIKFKGRHSYGLEVNKETMCV